MTRFIQSRANASIPARATRSISRGLSRSAWSSARAPAAVAPARGGGLRGARALFRLGLAGYYSGRGSLGPQSGMRGGEEDRVRVRNLGGLGGGGSARAVN